MAKRPRRTKRGPTPRRVPLASVKNDGGIPLIDVPAGKTLRIIVDVGPMAIPYAVAYNGRTLIKSLVDRTELVDPLESGDRVLGWSFAHIVKDWHHTIAYQIDGGTPVVLEKKAEARKDQDHTVGVAIVRH